MKSENKQIEEIWLKDVESIKVFAHETRLSIMKLLQTPTTVKDLAEKLSISASKLYYHINLLENHELIYVVDRKFEGNLVEKVYQAKAKHYKLINPLISQDFPDDSAIALFSTSMESTKADFLSSFSKRNKDTKDPPRYPFYSKKHFKLTDKQLSELHRRFDQLIQDVTTLGKTNNELQENSYELSLTFFQTEES